MRLGMTIHGVSQRQASTLQAAITLVDQMVELLAATWQVGHQRNRALFGVSISINFQPLPAIKIQLWLVGCDDQQPLREL